MSQALGEIFAAFGHLALLGDCAEAGCAPQAVAAAAALRPAAATRAQQRLAFIFGSPLAHLRSAEQPARGTAEELAAVRTDLAAVVIGGTGGAAAGGAAGAAGGGRREASPLEGGATEGGAMTHLDVDALDEMDAPQRAEMLEGCLHFLLQLGMHSPRPAGETHRRAEVRHSPL